MPMRLLSILICAIPFVAPALRAGVLMTDNFSDLSRTNQGTGTPLTTVDWYYLSSATGASISAASGALVITQASPTATYANFTSYFTAGGSPRTLANGETITLSFTLKLSSVADNTPDDVLVGLFESRGNRLSADDATASSSSITAFDTTRGYFAGFNTSSTATALDIFERNDADVTGGSAFATVNRTSLNSTTAATNPTANTAFNVSFSIARSGSNYSLSTTVKNTTFTASDSSISATAFDTISIQLGSKVVPASGVITLDNFQVAVTGVPIPEPSAYGALFGALALVFSLGTRRCSVRTGPQS